MLPTPAMFPTFQKSPDPIALRPLLRSILRELYDRQAQLRYLKARSLSPAAGVSEELALRAERATQKQALRKVEAELNALGWSWEEDGTHLRLVRRVARGIERLNFEGERAGTWRPTEVGQKG